MRWTDQPDVLDYIIDSYAGVEDGARQFIWEADGQTLIGNSRAFTDHLAARFNMPRTATSWASVHGVLRDLGEVVHGYTPRTNKHGRRFQNQQPVVRVVPKGGQ